MMHTYLRDMEKDGAVAGTRLVHISEGLQKRLDQCLVL